ncbi:ribonucleoside-diphosphate reductase subunit alpha [Blastopirellula marina]|uniref:Ribonucleoside-diphosphate reductase n=1 Tax=Blastopirellula marina TaxID=124 RepID=A0A2S8FMQ2_9BACT|nr:MULTISPECIES: ribonucleoside-diphosphate reductase subunit alpha [Pirellulaceae]PQO33483.1 ribonucleoside-diphosphate reductase subunit alpha [Blastopirellula marina]RCS52574.1 ribonucleoside-diphosphate reductase subunit alpha [Bremerella cremea]
MESKKNPAGMKPAGNQQPVGDDVMTTVTTQVSLDVRKRDGRITSFESARVEQAIERAFRAEIGIADGQPIEAALQQQISEITTNVVNQIENRPFSRDGVDVETIQDAVEIQLMRHGHFSVARRYILYREQHAKLRALRAAESDGSLQAPRIHVKMETGEKQPFDATRMRRRIYSAVRGLEQNCSAEELVEETYRTLYDGITPQEIYRAMILASRSRIERDPDYDTVAARLMLMVIYNEALGHIHPNEDLAEVCQRQFEDYINVGIEAKRLSEKLREFDLTKIAAALRPERDAAFPYLGLQTIYDRYLLHVEGRRIETPQYFWMRVAMGLAWNETDKEARAIEFYNILSTFRFTSATPTLFNAGTLHPQLSSCYLSTVMDDLEHIFKVVGDNAMLSKWAGGLGNDWSNIRATNAHIKGTNGQSQGVIPFLKVVNDTAIAVNQGGKRKGAVCSYLESWHLDIEEFLDLRKNTGDDRRRTHDMHTANWIPDLFMKRVRENGQWTLFSPDEVPDLHDLYGKKFQERYEHYEELADQGKMRMFRRINALELWRKMLTRLFETGHPWITWKDPSNVRSPQDHVGVVHSSNLCTEILLNTSKQETAVCNLGSINMVAHVKDGKLDHEKLRETVTTAVRMLDNVIDINYYPTDEAGNSNRKHRPVGLGLMGFQDALYALGVGYASEEAVEFADESMEAISYYALLASSSLAEERGTYQTYQGSKWDRGILPIDSMEILEQERGLPIDIDRSSKLDWQVVRDAIAKHGMRNSNVMAIAPTATISTIIGVAQSIEPTYKNLFVKSNLSGEFPQINRRMVQDLKDLGLWDSDMIESLKYYDGGLLEIDRIPDDIKQKYLTAFEVAPQWLIECAARRQKWLDMGQSLNLYMSEPSGKKLHEMYFLAWNKGLKTTYYLRTLSATQVEKSTVDVNKFGIQPRWMKNQSASANIKVDRDKAAQSTELDQLPEQQPEAKVCNLDGDCESCQ